MPAHPALVRYALAIKVERDHVLGFQSYPSRLSNQTPATGYGQPGSSGNSLDDSFLTGNSEPASSSAAFDENRMPVFNDSFTGSPATNVMLPGLGNNSGSVPISRHILVTIKSEARFEQTIHDGKGFSDHELRMDEQHAGKCGLVAPPEQLAAFCASQQAQPEASAKTAVPAMVLRISRINKRRNPIPSPPLIRQTRCTRRCQKVLRT